MIIKKKQSNKLTANVLLKICQFIVDNKVPRSAIIRNESNFISLSWRGGKSEVYFSYNGKEIGGGED